jgi:replicative DNA helicase
MINYNYENRIEIENEFLALLLNKQDLFNITQIKSKYLKSDRNKKIFDYSMECFKNYNVINPVKILELHKDFDVDYFTELFVDTFYYNNAWKDQLKTSEESIIKFYKEDVIKYLNEKIKKEEIKYDEFMDKMKKLDEIQLIDNTPTLTAKEIEDNINTLVARINLNHFEKLNRTLELVRGDFLIIGATTGAGKSGFMLNLMNDLMTSFQCIYFNMEMSKSTIYKRLVSIDADVPMDYLLNPTPYQKELIDKSLQKIEKAKMIVEHKANDIKQIRAIIGKLKDKDRHTVLFIDHLGLCKADGTKSLYEQATEVAKQLRQICLEYDCTIISASQLNRGAYSSDELSLSMLKDSGELENSASKVILLYRDKDSNGDEKVVDMNIEIAKNRDGICGIVKMVYDKTKQIFKEKV